jgi:hypothetical protein
MKSLTAALTAAAAAAAMASGSHLPSSIPLAPSFPPTGVSETTFPLPKIDFGDLLMLHEDTGVEITHHLLTLGGIQIVNIPKFKEARETALSSLAECLEKDSKNSVQTVMNDGSKRLTTGAGNLQGVPQEMTSICGSASNNLRSVIDTATRQLLKLLDASATPSASEVMAPYHSFMDLSQNGEHLEHLHSYFAPQAHEHSKQILSSSSKPFTMDLHTDAGLFIAMTNGYYSSTSSPSSSSFSSASPPRNGLYIQLPSGEVVEAETEPDSLVFMIGQGSADWLSPILGAKLRPLPHALSVDLSSGWTRSWYGKMFLPPLDAWLPDFEGSHMTYGTYRRQELSASKLSAESNLKVSTYLPAACGMMSSNRLLEMVQNTLCDNGNGVMCWQQCYPLSDYSCGTEAECIDTATGEPVDGTIMCPSSAGMGACEVQCPIPKNNTKDEFCWGVGTDMYMDGFTSIVSEKKGSTACLNLFFKEWTLDTKTKYGFGCVGVFLLGVFVEFLSSFRRTLYKTLRAGHLRNVLLMLLHCSQVCLGYFLMLAAMTYNVEIFCMVLAGVGTGHALFNLQAPPPANIDHCCAGGNDLSELLDDTEASVGKKKMAYNY